jgi:hypothetical protein
MRDYSNLPHLISKDTTSVLCHESLVLGQVDSADTYMISGLAPQADVNSKSRNHKIQLLLSPD